MGGSPSLCPPPKYDIDLFTWCVFLESLALSCLLLGNLRGIDVFIRSSWGCKRHLIMRILTRGGSRVTESSAGGKGGQALSSPWSATLSTSYSRGSGRKQPCRVPNSIALLDSGVKTCS